MRPAGGQREHGVLRGALRHARPDGAAAILLRGAITGGGTFLGGVFHTLPFLISNYHAAIVAAIVVVAVELVCLAWLRYRFFKDELPSVVRLDYGVRHDHREAGCTLGVAAPADPVMRFGVEKAARSGFALLDVLLEKIAV